MYLCRRKSLWDFGSWDPTRFALTKVSALWVFFVIYLFIFICWINVDIDATRVRVDALGYRCTLRHTCLSRSAASVSTEVSTNLCRSFSAVLSSLSLADMILRLITFSNRACCGNSADGVVVYLYPCSIRIKNTSISTTNSYWRPWRKAHICDVLRKVEWLCSLLKVTSMLWCFEVFTVRLFTINKWHEEKLQLGLLRQLV